MRIDPAHSALPRVEFPGDADSSAVLPFLTAENQPHFDALKEGSLRLPRCLDCARTGRPEGPVCPWCGSVRRVWEEASGRGVIHSRVRYHRAYLPEFAPIIPYVVAAVHLDEGPICYGLWLHGNEMPPIGTRSQAVAVAWPDGFCALGFRPEDSLS